MYPVFSKINSNLSYGYSNHEEPTFISTYLKILFKLKCKEHAMCYDTINESISVTNC